MTGTTADVGTEQTRENIPPQLRNLRERFIQTLAYEAGGLLLVTPIYALVAGKKAAESFTLMVALSVLVMIWSPIFNTLFDWVEGRTTGRSASDRPHRLRLLHAALLEVTSVVVTLPAVMWLGGHDFLSALAIDVGLTLAYAAYAYVFHFSFDKLRPVTTMPAAVSVLATTEQFGIHVMMDGYAADPVLLLDSVYLKSLLYDLPVKLGMHRICEPQVVTVGPLNPKDSGGISGFVMIAESHISFHTFPNRGFVTIDLYTCQANMDPQIIVSLLKSAFRLTDVDVFVQKRGLRYPSADQFDQDDILNRAA